jgi:glycerophosphoryl diester phosphodiesterase
MAHRGGPTLGFPENCIPTFARTLAAVPCPLIEFDVRMTQDSVLVLLHDDELALGTTGKGSLKETSWAELQELQLKDNQGVPSAFPVPAFTEVLHWFEGQPAVLVIDAKPQTNLELVLRAIDQSEVKHKSVLICYSLADATYVFATTPDLMLALGFNTDAQISALEQAQIPHDQILALTPREIQPPTYYARIHEMGISCSLGTNGNVDTLPVTAAATMYQKRFEAGADIICTDRPIEVASLFD